MLRKLHLSETVIIEGMANSFSHAITDPVIRRLAGPEPYQRGLDYFSHGHVESLEETTGGVSALVRADQDYRVTLTSDDGVLDYSCDCPVGSDGTFCKQCVAAALAWLDRDRGRRKPRRRAKEVTLADAVRAGCVGSILRSIPSSNC